MPAFIVFELDALCDSRDDSVPNLVRVPSPDALSDFPVVCDGVAEIDGESELSSDNDAESDVEGDCVSAELPDCVPTALCEPDTVAVREAAAEDDNCSLIDAPAEGDVERLIVAVMDDDTDLLFAPDVVVDEVREKIVVFDVVESGVCDAWGDLLTNNDDEPVEEADDVGEFEEVGDDEGDTVCVVDAVVHEVTDFTLEAEEDIDARAVDVIVGDNEAGAVLVWEPETVSVEVIVASRTVEVVV